VSEGTFPAAFLVGPRRLEIRELPVPQPGDGELVLRVEAATTCGTDLKVYRRGGHPRMLTVPGRFGHEMAGTVAAVGRGCRRFREGDRVVVLNSASCGECAACRAGRENLCRDLVYLNGAYGRYVLVPGRFVRRSTYAAGALPTEVAAMTEPLACVLHGLERVAMPAGGAALVVGLGPIGLMFVAVLARRGLRVVAADPNPSRLETARRLGAAAAVAVDRGGSWARELEELPGLVVEATGSPEGWSAALSAGAPGGDVLLFGGCAPGTTVPLDAHALHYGELRVVGAYHHRPATARAALELLAGEPGVLTPLLCGERPLAGLEAALQAMGRREALKVVIRP